MNNTVVSLSSVDDNTRYMVGRKHLLRDLEQSIKKSGIIENPILLKNGNRFTIISGHNRIQVLRSLGFTELSAEIQDSFDPDKFLRIVLKKIYYKSISFSGRLKAYAVLSAEKLTAINDTDLKSALQIPGEISKSFIDTYLSFDKLIYEYCNEKDAPYRIIEQIISADSFFAHTLTSLMRNNISISSLRNILDLYDDIKRDDKMNLYLKSQLENTDKEMIEAELFGILKNIRYPEIESYSRKINGIAESFKKIGAELSFPVYEEGQPVKVSVALKRKDGGEAYLKTLRKLSEIGADEITKLM
jgi:hypothetical protein